MGGRGKTSEEMRTWRDREAAKQKYVCPKCGREYSKANPATIDHILERSKGGTNRKENLQVICQKDNQARSRR